MEADNVQKIGKYKVLGALGRGSMGVVYRAQDPEIGRVVAIKVLRNPHSPGSGKSELERFKTEARSAGNLRHPHIITVFDVNIEGEQPYIVMDFLEGKTLAQILNTKGKLEAHLAIHYLWQIASGLDHAHAKKIVHRDIKPSNILIDRSDNAFILDFGVASFGENAPQEQSFLGTPNYMSPEQLLRRDIDHRADLFGLAVLAYEILTGVKPFKGENLAALVNNIINGQPPALTEICPGFPMALQIEFDRALAKQPQDRFSSAENMVVAFSTALGLSVPAGGSSGYSTAPGARKRKNSDWNQINASRQVIQPQEPSHERARRPTPPELSPWRPENRSFRADSFNLANAAQHEARPGTMYSANADVISTRGIQRSQYKSLNIILTAFCLLLSTFLLYSFFSAPEEQIVRQKLDGVITGSLETLPNAALPKPKVQSVPAGKAIHEVNDQQLIGILVDAKSSEATVIQALREARNRSLSQIVEASVFLLKRDSYVIRIETLKLLSELADPRIVPYVVTTLDDHDPLVRRWAARTLGKIGDRKVVGYLEARLIKDDVEEVKTDIKKAIERITGLPYAS